MAPPPGTGGVAVDIASLEDFRAKLDARLSQAATLLAKFDELGCAQPQVGTLTSGVAFVQAFGSRRAEYRARLARLQKALQVTRDNTDTIIANYRTAEERNAANAKVIAAQLSGIGNALSPGTTTGAT
jgi:hypothetical protein